MFQEMINGSIAVLTKPSVATFEEHERNNLTWALIYSVIAGVINAIIAAIAASLGLNQPAMTGLDPEMAAAAQPSIIGAIFGAIIFTVLVLLISWGITYLLGRAFGGTGQFGELAYGLSLFGAPLLVIGSILNLIPFVGWIAGLALAIYNLYLTYLAIQSGMNLPSNKALYVILIQFAIALAIGLCFILFFAAIFAAMMGANGGFAP
ncbi:MAG TPA: Yip1 family protein [Chloroflexaceae bacterium]|nr:Yip1 family protein [Chloroflexaceae bacterium]